MIDENVFCLFRRGCVSAIRVERNRRQRVLAGPQVCNVCGKTLHNQHSLRNHLKRHYNERPHRCDHPGCEKAFVEMGALKGWGKNLFFLFYFTLIVFLFEGTNLVISEPRDYRHLQMLSATTVAKFCTRVTSRVTSPQFMKTSHWKLNARSVRRFFRIPHRRRGISTLFTSQKSKVLTKDFIFQ